MMRSLPTQTVSRPHVHSEHDSDDVRWAALVAGQAVDGTFVYAVTTTGIACRPTCASRRPLRKNTRFFDSFHQAASAGFRACRRCRPEVEAPHAEQLRLIERICRVIDDAETAPDLATLAAEAGMSRFHFHRVFRAAVGVTPRAYAAARRRERFQRALPSARSVTDAAYDAGYNSSSRLYANAGTELGMAPGEYRAGGGARAIRFAVASCSLGAILVATTERGVCAIDLGDDGQNLSARFLERFPNATSVVGDTSLERNLEMAIALVDGAHSDLKQMALDIAGTAFAQRVWAALRDVPFGETATYGEIAERIGAPRSARAVARACAANPIALAVPCHRVVRDDGVETSYRWGAARKRELLRRERVES